MDLQSTFASLGTTPILFNAEQCEQLDQNGYLPLPEALDESALRAIAGRTDEVAAIEGVGAGAEFRREEGTDRLANLVDKVFECCCN